MSSVVLKLVCWIGISTDTMPVLNVILRSLSSIVSEWPETKIRLAVDRNGVKYGGRW